MGDKRINTIGVVSRLDKPEALDCALKLIDTMRARGYDIIVEYHLAKRLKIVRGKLDGIRVGLVHDINDSNLIIVIGGDGTLLRFLHYAPRGVRVIGVRVGRRGFLMNFECNETDIEYIADGGYKLCNIHRLVAEGVYAPPAVNEIALIAARGKTIALGLSIICEGGEEKIEFRGDGVLISTDVGSHAYSLSAGGPLLYCKECIGITPLNPLPGVAHPMIISNKCKITLRVIEGYRAPWLIVDGQYTVTVPLGKVFSISAGEEVLIGFREKCPGQ